jgi:hypothetical protein
MMPAEWRDYEVKPLIRWYDYTLDTLANPIEQDVLQNIRRAATLQQKTLQRRYK